MTAVQAEKCYSKKRNQEVREEKFSDMCFFPPFPIPVELDLLLLLLLKRSHGLPFFQNISLGLKEA